MNRWTKASIVGALAALVMFLLMQLAINSGMAPFNAPPSAAFLAAALGLQAPLLALAMHFGYAIFWSVLLVARTGDGGGIGSGLLLGAGLWLLMMAVWTPLTGWGFFGFGAADLPADHVLHLGSPIKFIVATLVLHLVYGGIVGGLNPAWIEAPSIDRGDAMQTPA